MDLWKRFYGLLKGYRLTYVFLYLTKLSYMVLKMLMPLVLATFVDEVLYHHNVDAIVSLVLLYIVLFIAFVILSGVCAYLSYPGRRELSWILIVLLALSYLAMWYLI